MCLRKYVLSLEQLWTLNIRLLRIDFINIFLSIGIHEVLKWLLVFKMLFSLYYVSESDTFQRFIFMMKFNGRKIFYLNLEFKTFERQQIYSLFKKWHWKYRDEQKHCLLYSVILVNYYHIQISMLKIFFFKHSGNW